MAARTRLRGSSLGQQLALTPRELVVLELLGEGVRAKAIAIGLGLSEATVRNHIRTILAKLGCHSQLEAVAAARRNGII